MAQSTNNKVSKARLRSNVLGGFDKEEAFLSAWIVTLFKTMAVMVRKTFKTAEDVATWIEVFNLGTGGWYISNSLQRRFLMALICLNDAQTSQENVAYNAFSVPLIFFTQWPLKPAI